MTEIIKQKRGGARQGSGAKPLPYKSKRISLGVKEEFYVYLKTKWTKEVQELNAGTRKKKKKYESNTPKRER